jgi:hypothetical protein
LGAICCKIVRAKGNQNPNIKWLLWTCIASSWNQLTILFRRG